MGSSSDGGKHKFDADTINTVAQSLQSGVKFSRDVIDIHFPICFPVKEELDSEVQRENSIVQAINYFFLYCNKEYFWNPWDLKIDETIYYSLAVFFFIFFSMQRIRNQMQILDANSVKEVPLCVFKISW